MKPSVVLSVLVALNTRSCLVGHCVAGRYFARNTLQMYVFLGSLLCYSHFFFSLPSGYTVRTLKEDVQTARMHARWKAELFL